MMKQKERDVLSILMEHKEEFVTSQELASVLALSDRTVRTYLQKLKELAEVNGALIEAKPGYGYKLIIQHKLAFELFLKKSEIIKVYRDDKITIAETTDRQNYILNKLLLEDSHLFLEPLSERLYVSRSTLSKDFAEIKNRLKVYRLTVENRSGKGVWINGNERDKRHFIMDYFFGNNYANSLKKYVGNSQYFDDINTEELTIIILDECREAKLKVSDFIIQNLVLHLSLSIKRIRGGFEINDIGVDNSLESTLEYQIAKRILSRIESVSKLVFPVAEVSYLALHLMAKSNSQQFAKNQATRHLAQEIVTVLKTASKNSGYPLVSDRQLRNGLLDHLKPMLVRLERGIKLENPLLLDIVKDHHEVFTMTKHYLSMMPSLQGYSVCDDEWAYLTLHLMAAIEKYHDRRKLQVLIICATGYGSAQLLKNRVIKEFGKHINVVAVHGYYEINEHSLKEIDLIISSIDLSTLVFKVPVLHVSVFLKDQDVSLIRKQIDMFVSQSGYVKKRQNLPNEQKEILFDRQIKAEYFTFIEEKERAAVLKILVEQLSEQEEEQYSEKMLEQIKQRESMSPVVFSNEIVVPHPAQPVGIETKIGVALIPEGLYWNAEFPAIKFVFLLSTSYFENEGITAITKAIVALIDEPEIQQKMLVSANFEEFRQLFLRLM